MTPCEHVEWECGDTICSQTAKTAILLQEMWVTVSGSDVIFVVTYTAYIHSGIALVVESVG